VGLRIIPVKIYDKKKLILIGKKFWWPWIMQIVKNFEKLIRFVSWKFSLVHITKKQTGPV